MLPEPEPVPVTNTPAPENIANQEELFLAGQRIDQFHNPTLDADPYWEEVLRRDPGDVSANTGMGILDLRDAKFASAEQHFRKAIERLTFQYTTPKNGEPLYYLGVALKAQGLDDEAFTAFYKAAWNQEWKSPAYFSLAEIATKRGDFPAALNFVSRSLDANALNVRAYGLKASILRHLNRTSEVPELIDMARKKCDPLDVRLMAERWIGTKDMNDAYPLFSTMNAHPATALEIAAEYYSAGLWSDGIEVLLKVIETAPKKATISPLIYYYLGFFSEKSGDNKKASEYRHQAALISSEYVFPFQYELIAVLHSAIKANPQDAKAPYYLGNLIFDGQPAEATVLWEKSAALDPEFPMIWRNLAIAYSHGTSENSLGRAIESLERAVSLSDPYPTHFTELDRLYQRAGTPVEKRLALLEKNQKAVNLKDEALGALITLKIFLGKTDEAIALLKNRTFSIWEGGGQFSSGQAWVDAHLVSGLKSYRMKKYSEALAAFEAANTLPDNLRSERSEFRQAEIAYWTGCALSLSGQRDKAKKAWERVMALSASAPAVTSGAGRRAGNPLEQHEQLYYRARAQQKTGNTKGIETVFQGLVSTGTSALDLKKDNVVGSIISNERQSRLNNNAVAHYIIGLGYSGLGNKEKAREEFISALAASPDYLSAKIALGQLDWVNDSL